MRKKHRHQPFAEQWPSRTENVTLSNFIAHSSSKSVELHALYPFFIPDSWHISKYVGLLSTSRKFVFLCSLSILLYALGKGYVV